MHEITRQLRATVAESRAADHVSTASRRTISFRDIAGVIIGAALGYWLIGF
jgi:hypothetical protein